jgi:RNA-directed DNA polymerase
VLSLIEAFLKANILDGLEEWSPATGAPQGAVLSPLLSNIYLDPLDHLVARSGLEMVRYADDFVILCRTPEEASRALELVQQWVSENGLTLHPTKTKVVDARTVGFDFLGYHFEGGKRWPRTKSLTKFKDAIRVKTRRTQGDSLRKIIGSLNRTLRGWFEYFKHSQPWIFSRLDGMIRRRLRSLLDKRAHRPGSGRGLAHKRWPNAFFAKQGLFSLERAHVLVRQPSQR